MAPSSSLTLLLLFLVAMHHILFSPIHALVNGGFRTYMTHVDSSRNITKLQSIHQSLKRGEERMTRLVARTMTPDVSEAREAPVHAGEGEFIVDLVIGTPGLPFQAIVDTGSDLVWTQCKPCDECFKQETPVFDPSKSSTFRKPPCSDELCLALSDSTCEDSECRYSYSYGDNSNTRGVLGSDTVGFGPSGNNSVPHIGFGCGESNSGRGFSQASGLLGLGRGPLSLISQLNLGQFSYCLTNFGQSKKSPLLFGSFANRTIEKSSTEIQTTPLLKNPSHPSFYFLNLKGITVGGTLITVPTVALGEDGTSGMIIDSGTSITYLERKGYDEVKKAFLSHVQLPVVENRRDIDLDLCFSAPTDPSAEVEVPKLKFHFEGADLDLPPENYMVLDQSSGLLCLALMGSRGMSIFGNFQQQNLQVLYDLHNERLAFAPARCDQI